MFRGTLCSLYRLKVVELINWLFNPSGCIQILVTQPVSGSSWFQESPEQYLRLYPSYFFNILRREDNKTNPEDL